jgi:hypothetical protein
LPTDWTCIFQLALTLQKLATFDVIRESLSTFQYHGP